MLFKTSGKVASFIIRNRKKRLQEILHSPIAQQHKWLKSLLAEAKQTDFGQAHNFEKIQTYHDFKSEVPLSQYQDILQASDRIRGGETNILWPGETKHFAKSSGTTDSKSKYIPVTEETLKENHFKGGKDLLSLYLQHFNPDSEVFLGKTLILGGSQKLEKNKSNVLEGDLSALLIANIPIWVTLFQCPSRDVALMENWEKKLNRIATESIDEDIRSISGVPSWTLLLLRRVLEMTGKKTILEVWPHLELYIHGGVSFVPYRSMFKEVIGGEIHYLETYNASEGFFAIQDRPLATDMLLLTDHGIFYEFRPLNKGAEYTVALEDVETDVIYAVIISTNSGLWRYELGDTIEFTEILPYRIKIVGRTKHFINAFGEELMIDNAERGIAIACEKTNAKFHQFTAAPILDNNKSCGYHQWIVEFTKTPNDIALFAQVLDETLQKLNGDYEAKRFKSMVLQPLKVELAEPGLFYAWMKERGKLGGQNKVPRLSNSDAILQELIARNNTLKNT